MKLNHPPEQISQRVTLHLHAIARNMAAIGPLGQMQEENNVNNAAMQEQGDTTCNKSIEFWGIALSCSGKG